MSLVTEREGMVSNPLVGEPVTYLPAAGGSRTIWAIVNRQAVELGRVGTLAHLVAVTKSATTGVAAPELGKDRVQLKKHVGDAAVAMATVDEIVAEDGGGYTLLVSF